MILGIDASNIRAGGGVTHLVELLRAADPAAFGFSRVIVWAGPATQRQIDERSWLVKDQQPLLAGGLAQRMFWQRFHLSSLARASACDVLFVPGGSFAGDFRPRVAMSQNLLPFEWIELRRYGPSWMATKLALLRWTQSRSFRRADGVVFLTSYAKTIVSAVIRATSGPTVIVAHGIADRFVRPPRAQRAIGDCSAGRPFRILYVSKIDMYKHQWHVADAVSQLRNAGMPVTLELIGPAYPPALEKLRATLDRVDPERTFVNYRGDVAYDDLATCYAAADLCIFASSCENMPMILLEGMASGLPIVCARRGPMPEVLGDAGAYFDPEQPADIARAAAELIASPELRAAKARASFERARTFSWQRCASETFGFLSEIGRRTALEAVS